MKNLLVYINPEKKFDEERAVLARIQIDNSFSLGWKKEDIIFVTNFSYEYNGVKAIVVGDEHFYESRPKSIKTAIVPFLVDTGIIEKGKIYWNHDFDAYQNVSFDEAELRLDNVDAGLTDYGWRDKWCMGSFFFKEASKDIFQLARDLIYKNTEDEGAMMELTKKADINKRCKRLNITYNFGMRVVMPNYERAIKPLRILHFHPVYKWVQTLDIFMYGKSGLKMPLMTERLIKIFHHHGIK
jgi:hypothetical protein